MNLLMVAPYLPAPSWGASTRSYYLLQALARKYSVSLLALSDSYATNADNTWLQTLNLKHLYQVTSASSMQNRRFKKIASTFSSKSYLMDLFYKKEIQQKLDTLLLQNNYDTVIFESIFMTGYHVPDELPVVIDQHNIEHELLERTYKHETSPLRKWFNWREAHKIKPLELERCRQVRSVLVTSEREYLLLKKLAPQCHAEVVPNGVDIEMFRKDEAQQEVADRVIFTGTMNYYPNIQAVLFFARECWPRIRAQIPTATWQIVGKSPPPEVEQLATLPGVTVTGAVPDIRPYLSSASVAIAPLFIGSGTRLKILEALAMQKAVVSTSLGCEGLAVESEKQLCIANQPEQFSQAVIDLLLSPAKRASLGQAGRTLVESRYSWEQCGNAAIHAIQNVVTT